MSILFMNMLRALPQYSFSLLQNQLDSFQILTVVSVSYALAVHFTPCQNQCTTK